ncbi:TlpA disulfide reductase family protein [Tropicimonas sp. IMCC6043]|uniref:TlpA disulfide reductase family protein n=1 Tax=Tropicimonas sp. IMCC6043 TaxID=2510645 RepID=UPI00101DF623|nr:TlpA disulfide reductase family protein [Tropicimonas sp. IMCC6043]RYH10564.1 TlpA family protein disulfide reductase [Tropicimonas sp. IMCC6043]
MKHLVAATVYTCLALLANTAPGLAADIEAIAALREGDMKKLVLHDAPKSVEAVDVVDMSDAPVSLAHHRGKWLVVNFWATWCAPCRKEMPTLANLQSEMAGKPVEVITVAVGRNPPAAITRFMEEIGATDLVQYRDPRQALARSFAVLGLPVTVILDPEGAEVGRLIGDAEWDSDSARQILEALSTGS